MDKTDEQLIADYIAGDNTALAVIVKKYLSLVYNFVFRLVGNRRDADDITQEAFIKMWRGIKKYQPGRNFKTWLFSIAHNAAIDFWRKKKDLVFSEFETDEGKNPLIENMADPAPLPDELIVAVQRESYLDGILNQLPPVQREVLFLHYKSQLTFEEISQVLGRPINTVRSRHWRGLIALRKLLEASGRSDSL